MVATVFTQVGILPFTTEKKVPSYRVGFEPTIYTCIYLLHSAAGALPLNSRICGEYTQFSYPTHVYMYSCIHDTTDVDMPTQRSYLFMMLIHTCVYTLYIPYSGKFARGAKFRGFCR